MNMVYKSQEPYTINSLQITCDTQTTQIFNSIAGKVINDLSIPMPPVPFPSPFPIPAWFQAVDSTTNISIGAVYVDETDSIYDYRIILSYKLLGAGTCQSNPISSCTCIQLLKTDKAGTPAADNILPPGVILNAISILPIVSGGFGTVCTDCDPTKNYCILGTCIPRNYVIYGAAAFAAMTFLSMIK